MRDIFLFISIISAINIYSQDSLQSTIPKKSHSPQVAAILSAVLPGAGQMYNKKYWKAPIVWGGLAAFTALYIAENNKYQTVKTSYLSLIDTISTNNIPYNGTYDVGLIQSTKNVFKNQRDMYLVLGIIFYGLNIVDATVDAHLLSFDVSDNLSMNVNFDMKNYVATQNIPSLCLNFKLKK